MRDFWDARAAEDPYYFVDNRLAYGDPDTDEFWRDGERLVDEILGVLGLELRPSDELVEIGCGIGRMTRALAARCGSVRALDVSPRMLELARAHNPELANVEWLLGDGTTLAPIADRSADACFSHVVFQHLPDPAIALGYVARDRPRSAPRGLGGVPGIELARDPPSPVPGRPRPDLAPSRPRARAPRAGP